MPSPKNATLPIRRMAALTGVNAVTLRAWERRYGLVRPARTPKGHRLYSPDQVERIRRVVALVERGVPIGRVQDLIDTEPAPELPAAAGRWREHLERMATAITRFDEPELDRIYDEALSVHPVEQVTRLLLLPLLAHLGERWRGLPGAIAEEHFFAMYLRSKLGARLQHRMRYAEGPRLLGACAPGELHEIGLLLFALEAQAAGMRMILLGADTPLEDIAIAARRGAADAVIVSSSIEPEAEFLSDALRQLVRQAGAPVFVGGSTAERHARAIEAAGAIPVGVELEHGVRLVASRLAGEARR
jgi:DNA-binding transcriptional MerR regulator